MIGLIKKDLFLIAKNLSPLYLASFLVVIVPITQNPTFLMPIIGLMVSLLFASQILTTLSLDESANWEKNISAMPISCSEEVASKYIVSTILALISSMIVFIVGVSTINFIKLSMDMIVFYIALSFSLGILYDIIVIPSAFKFGTAKCRFVLLIFVTLPTIIPFVLEKLNIKVNPKLFQFNISQLMSILLILVFISMIISYIISVNIQKRKV